MTQVQSLSRAFALLEQLAGADTGLTLTDLSGRVHLAPSTVHRLLNSLKQMGYVECDNETGRWSVGVQSFTVGNAFLKKRDFVVRARPFMKELVALTGETANIAIPDGHEVVYMGQVETREVMRMAVPVGSRGTVYATGVGKALLSHRSEGEIKLLLKGVRMTPFTEKTCSTVAGLCRELEAVATQGYAVDDEEQSIGLRCVAANIYNNFGEAVAAVSISGPTVRVTKNRLPELGTIVMKSAEKITLAIGGLPPEKH